MNDELDPLDNLIDAALTSYTPQAARPGLERRILASVAAAGRPAAWRWPLWALSGAVVLLAAALLFVTTKPARPVVAVLQHPVVSRQLGEAAPASPAAHTWPLAQIEHTHTMNQSASNFIVRRASASSLAIAPIETQPITIAPIQISALN
jgi:anti-sigma-K factor RskA